MSVPISTRDAAKSPVTAFWIPSCELAMLVGALKNGMLESLHAVIAPTRSAASRGTEGSARRTRESRPGRPVAVAEPDGVEAAVMSEAQVEGEEEATRGRVLEDVLRRRHLLVAEDADLGVQSRVGERHPEIPAGERESRARDVHPGTARPPRELVGKVVAEGELAKLREVGPLQVREHAPGREGLRAR